MMHGPSIHHLLYSSLSWDKMESVPPCMPLRSYHMHWDYACLQYCTHGVTFMEVGEVQYPTTCQLLYFSMPVPPESSMACGGGGGENLPLNEGMGGMRPSKTPRPPQCAT